MAYASITYTSASGTTFALTNSSGNPIQYLRQSDIAVTVNGTLKTQGTDYTFNSAGTAIVLATAVSGATVVISRTTSITDATVSFTAGSTLTAQDLNNSDKQNRFALQEFSDTYAAITTGTGDLSVLGGFIGSAETWLSDNAHTATTGAIDVRVDSKIDTALTGDVVAGNAITITDNSPASGQITIAVTNGAIEAAELASNAVTTAKIADSNVTTAKINDAAVTTAKINDSAVTTAKLADDSVTSAKIADGTIIAGDIAANAVTTAKILDANVTTAKIADSAVTNAKLATDSVTQAKMADNSVGTAEIIDGAVTNAKLADADLQTLANSQTGAAAAFALLTSTEVATLDGITSTTSELNILDGVTANASELNTLDGITASTSELNQLDGKTITGTFTPANADDIPTSSAINSYVLGLMNSLGGFVAIPNENSFPTTNPDPSDNAGTVVSIANAGGMVINGSGVGTGQTTGGDTVTITGFPSTFNSTTIQDGLGLQVQTTTTLHTYTYHKVYATDEDVRQLSQDVNDFKARYRVGSTNPTTDLDSGDLFFNTGSGKMLVYDGTSSAWEEVQSIGNFYINTLSSSAGTGGGSASFNGTAYRFTLSNPPTFAQQLIVSINGVVQKPNSGTAQPTEGFAIDGSDIIFGAAPASGSAFFIITMGSTVNIGTPSDNTVTAAKIVDGTITNAKISSTAAIAGTKISPDFGAQNLVVDTNTLFVDATNNRVGVGTTSPNQSLHVNGIIQAESSGNYLQLQQATNDSYINNTGSGGIIFRQGTGFAERARFDSSGRLGIGTSSVSANLHIAKNTNGNVASIRVSGNDGAGDGGAGLLFADNEAVKWSIFTRRYSSNNRLYISTAENDANSSKVTITEGGSVGIGTTSPQSKFVVSNGGADGLEFTTNSDQAIVSYNRSTSAYAPIGLQGSQIVFSAPSERARIDSSGRLLVGTSSDLAPDGFASKLQVASTDFTASLSLRREGNTDSAPSLLFAKTRSASLGGNTSVNNGDGLGNIFFYGADGTDVNSLAARIYCEVDGTPGANDMPGRLVFSVTSDGSASPTERQRISADGYNRMFAANNTLAVLTAQGAGTSFPLIEANYSATGIGINDGTVSFRVWSNGNVVNTNNSYGAISDVKLKENIVDASSQWDDLKALRVRNYNFKEGQTHTQIGLVAQEVELVSPGLVTESPDRDKDGNDLGTVTKSVNYSVLYMKAVKALQEAMERIETLEARLTAAGIE